MPRLHIFKSHSDLGHRATLGLLASAVVAMLLPDDILRLFALGPAGMERLFPVALVVGALALVAHERRQMARRLAEGDAADARRLEALQTDPLSGALTRGVFLETFRAALADQRRTKSRLSLVLMDLDYFKALNDSYGHSTGDEAIAHLADVARGAFPGAAIGRLGGDEFALLVTETEAGESLRRAEAFLKALNVPAILAKRRITLSASVGIAEIPGHTSFFEEALIFADLALYESKRLGRRRVTLFDPEMQLSQRHKRFIERELRAAIFTHQLELHYQTIHSATGMVLGAEALVRWMHPTRGRILPGEFVAIAEESSLIERLGEWVLRRACRDFAALPGSFVSVNLSAAQLRSDEVVDMVAGVLRETGMDPSALVLEVTENVALAATPEILARVARLRDLGVQIALDDFGTGHCGFNYLRSLPIDVIKIDRSYIARMAEDPVANIFVAAVVETARALMLRVVAEGVETERERTMAAAAGCQAFQGYLLGRPTPVGDLCLLARNGASDAPRFAAA